VVVVAAAEELDEVGVVGEHPGDVLANPAFAAGLDTEVAVEPEFLGDVEQRRLAVGADRREHCGRLRGRVRCEGRTLWHTLGWAGRQ